MDQDFPFHHFFKPSEAEKAPQLGRVTSPLPENPSNEGDHFSEEELKTLQLEILNALEEQIGTKKFKAYFDETFRLINIEEEKLIFEVATPFIKTMIEKHYSQVLAQLAQQLLGKPYQIEFEIISQHNRSLSSNSKNILNTLSRPLEKVAPLAKNTNTAKEASFKLDLTPSKDDLINQIKSKYINHMTSEFEVSINPNKTFDNFIVGPFNHMAYSSAVAIAKAPGRAYPSTYFHSNSGLGKTHLLHAIANKIFENHPTLRICIITARDFMTEMINALQSNVINDFRKKYSEDVDVLMIDDIQELKNKQSTQNEFFHVFNELHNKGKQLIFTSDQDPKEIVGIEERIKTRLSWGLVSDIHPPDMEARIAILKRKAQEEDIYLPDDVINLIASAYKNNIRELEGSLIRLGAYASLFDVDIDIEIAKNQLKLTPQVDPNSVSIDAIARRTSSHFRIPVADLRSKARYKEVTLARHLAMYLSYKLVKTTYEEIGYYFGKRDHTSVLHAVEKITSKLKTDPDLSQILLEIENSLI